MKTYEAVIKEYGIYGRRIAHAYVNGIKELRAFARMPIRYNWCEGHDGPVHYFGIDPEHKWECIAREV